MVRLETRTANLEGRGEINQRELLRNALRMRPDRIIVGEVRGSEAYDMLQAMNTGHDGSISTVHANTTRDALARVENMVQMATVNLPARAIRTQIASAVDLIIQIERMRDGVRRISQISDICGMEGDVITMNDVVSFEYRGRERRRQDRRPLPYDRRTSLLRAQAVLLRPGDRLDGCIAEPVTCPATQATQATQNILPLPSRARTAKRDQGRGRGH